ncbi:MAG: hypothetical protein AAF717_18450 [Bacteroidota bacterium]
MPANKKYLATSRWTRTSKFLAAFLGGFIVLIFLVMALSSWLNPKVVVITAIYAGFIVWIFLMLLVYWIKKAWVSWLIFAVITLVSALFMYLGN